MNKPVSEKSKFIWNMLGSLSNALATVVLSISVNRILGGNSGGIFALAYSNAQLMLTVGEFEVRNYQATDIEEKYTFGQYFTFRIITCFLTIPIVFLYILGNHFSLEEAIIVFVLVMFKNVEAFADVYAGRFQQKDRIDLSGKLFFVRVVVSTILFIVTLSISKNLVLASIVMALTSFFLFFIYDYHFVFVEDKGFQFNSNRMLALFKDALPLFIGAFVMMYVSNAPKYAIDTYYTNDLQNIYNILFMPASVINLFSIFVFRPLLFRMTMYWRDFKLQQLTKLILLMNVGILAVTGVAMVVAWLLGIPVLSFLYAIDLDEYKWDLVFVMVAGGLSALMTFGNNVLVVIRKQSVLIPISIISFVFSIVFVPMIVNKYAVRGAVIAYGMSIGLIVILYTVVIVYSITKEKRNGDNR